MMKTIATLKTSHAARLTSHAARLTSHIARRTSHITRRTSHVARNTSHITRLALSVLFTIAFGVAYAQPEPEGGQIEDVQIEITKVKQITLPRASRNFEKIAPRPAEPLTPAMTYDFRPLRFTAPDYNPVVKPLRLKDPVLSKIYGNYISVGYGNYNSPFLRGSISSKRNAEKFYGADFFHRSFGKGPVRGDESASGYTKLAGYISGMGPKITADMGLNYERLTNKFYGEIPGPTVGTQRDDQQFNIVGLNAAFSNTKDSDFNFKLAGEFSYLDDWFAAAESEAGLHFNSRYEIDENQSFSLKGDYYLVARKDEKVEAKPRHLFRVNPVYEFLIADKLRLSAGVNAVIENDTIGKAKTFHLYPDAWIHYDLVKEVDAYAGITGDFEKVSLHTMARENQWLNSNVSIFHTNKSFEFRAGVQGKVLKKFSFNVGTSVINFKHLYFYQMSQAQPDRFDVLYDDALRLNFFGEFGLVHSDKVSINTRLDQFSYSMDKLDYPWHRPTFKVGVYTSYKLFDKLLLTVDFASLGGMKAFNYQTNRTETLKTVANLDAKLRYFVSKRFSVFVEGNNMLNSKYFLYQNYLARGAQVSAGVSWSF
jgi:hypothetical protein